MELNDYLSEIRPAVDVVMAEIHREQDVVQQLDDEIERLKAATDDGYQRMDFLARNPDLDDDGLATAIYWDTYFGADKDRYYKDVELRQVVDRIAVREFSVSALCGNLLQYAKQGISIQYGKNRSGCPDGRVVGGLPLHEIIWQARNQALHWEDGAFSQKVTDCFEALAASVDPTFADYTKRSMAREVVTLVGWDSVDAFFRDMARFIPT